MIIIRLFIDSAIDQDQPDKILALANKELSMTFKTLVSTHDVSQCIAHKDSALQTIIIDCRFDLMNTASGKIAWSASHIPGARYAHLDDDLAGEITSTTGRHPLPHLSDLIRKFAQWGVSNDSQVIAYDDSGGAFAARLWWILRWLGHEKVAVLDGGWSKWRNDNMPLESQAPTEKAGNFTAAPDDQQWISTEALAHALSDNSVRLIDARTRERFDGISEPIDPIAGHVPGAINHPFQQNLDEKGCFLPTDILREKFEALLGDTDPKEVVHMCGSGVTAIHNMLAMEHTGLQGSRLYVGSWSEWIRTHIPA